MKLPDLFVNAIATFDGKALAKGQRQIGSFEKSVKSLAKAFGVTFGAVTTGPPDAVSALVCFVDFLFASVMFLEVFFLVTVSKAILDFAKSAFA